MSILAATIEPKREPAAASRRETVGRGFAPAGRKLGQALAGLAVPIALVTVWQLASTNGALFGGALPSPERVWDGWLVWAFGKGGLGLNPYSGTWWDNVVFSSVRVAKGFALAILIGVPLGIMIGWSRAAATTIDPTIQILRPIPITAWLPISLAIFGIRDFGAIFLILLGAFYPIVINSMQGARGIERNWIRAAMMMGASRTAILRRVVLPAALPSIFTGLRIGLGIGWTAVIVSEMVAVKSGLGYVLWDAYYVGRMEIVIADMVSIGAMGFLSDRLIVLVEHWALRWRRLQSFQG